MTILRFTLLLLCTPLLLYAQSQPLRVPDFPADRYVGGDTAFYRFFAQNLRYPASARHAGIIGTAILGFTLLPNGELTDIELVNPLSKDLDNEIKRVFSETAGNWFPSSQALPVRMYLPIAYTLDGVPLIRAEINDKLFIEEIIMKAFGRVQATVKPSAKLIDKLYKFIEKEKHRKALHFADELIRRDPFNKQWFLMRSTIHKEIGDAEAVCSDLKKIQDLLQYPVSDKLVREYCQ